MRQSVLTTFLFVSTHSEQVLARVVIQLSELGQLINPEPYDPKAGGKILPSATAGHTGWYAMEEVAADIYTSKGITNLLRDATVNTVQTASNVTSSAVSSTSSAVSSTVSSLMRMADTGDEDTAMDGNSSSNAATTPGKPSAAAAAVQAARAKNSYISILSSDQPRENLNCPQLRLRVRIIEENA